MATMADTDADADAFLYAMDPATTLYTFFFKTDPSINSVRLIGSWDNFSMSYAMQRDSRREGGQWRGCHTFKDIICDGDASSSKRSGGLKMGSTYYYYYEVDALTETHNPALPSTTACPYLPGQRVNTLCVPTEHASRQRSASVTSAHTSDFKTMDPAHKFVTPRPPPAPPAVAPALGPELRSVSSLSALRRPLSPLPSPRKLLHHQCSVRSLSPAPSVSTPPVAAPPVSASSFSSWSPRRFFARRASPSRDVANADGLKVGHKDDDNEDDGSDKYASARHGPPSTRLPSSSSSSISPESLRLFLVQDDVVDTTVDTLANQQHILDTTETDYDDNFDFEMDDDDDEDDANFATSAVSENAPLTILSPPPPSRSAMSISVAEQQQKQQQQQQQQQDMPLPARPKRAPPAPPTVPVTSVQRNLAHMNLGLAMPSSSMSTKSSTSHLSLTSMSSLSPMLQSEADDDDDDDDDEECYGTAGGPAALFLPSSQHPFDDFRPEMKREQSQSHYYHQHLLDVASTGSTATLVPGNGLITANRGNGLNELVDELGWMATAIRG